MNGKGNGILQTLLLGLKRKAPANSGVRALVSSAAGHPAGLIRGQEGQAGSFLIPRFDPIFCLVN